MTAEVAVYRKALEAVAIAGIAVGALGAGFGWMLAGPDSAVAAALGGVLGIVVSTVGPVAMLLGLRRSPAGLAGTVATGWIVALGIALTGLAVARNLDRDLRIALGLTFVAVVLAGLVAKAVVTARGRVPYVGRGHSGTSGSCRSGPMR